jgi:charged multivesicular body protein 4
MFLGANAAAKQMEEQVRRDMARYKKEALEKKKSGTATHTAGNDRKTPLKKSTKSLHGSETTRTTAAGSVGMKSDASASSAEKKRQSAGNIITDNASVSVQSNASASSAEKKRRGPLGLFQRHNRNHSGVPSVIQTTSGIPQSAPAAALTQTVVTKSEEALAIEKIQQCIAKQEKREEDLKVKINTLVADAKRKLASGDKKAALFDMKRKKIYEEDLDKLQNAKFTMETQIMKIESAMENKEMYEAMVAGSSTMKKLQDNLGVDEVDTAIDDIREALENALEINASLAQDVNPMPQDEDELLAELMALTSEPEETPAQVMFEVSQWPELPESIEAVRPPPTEKKPKIIQSV